MTVSGRTLATHASSLLPAPAPHHPPTVQQPFFSFMRLFCILAVFLRTGAAAKGTSPSSDGFQGLCLVPWLAAKIRLRRKSSHRTAVSRFKTGPHRVSPIPTLAGGLDPSGSLNLARLFVWPLWISPRSIIRSSLRDPDEVLPSLQCQSEPFGCYHQAEKPSSSEKTTRPVEPNRTVEPSRPVEPSRRSEPNQWSRPVKPDPGRTTQLLFSDFVGLFDFLCRPRSDIVGLFDFLCRPRSDMAQFLGPFTYT